MQVKGVVHCKRSKFDVYIGRPSKWGNPFVLTDDRDREYILNEYGLWLLDQTDLMRCLPELDGKILGCWCKPKLCHGDVLADLVELVV
jgi:hypothetical protein